MHRFVIVPAIVLLAVVTSGCGLADVVFGGRVVQGSGDVIDEAREVDGFRAVAVHSGLDVVIQVDDTQQVMVRGHENLVPLVETVVEDGVLQVRPTEEGTALRGELTVAIQAAELEAVSASGGAEVRLSDGGGGTLSLSASGGATLLADDIRRSRVELSASGGADLSVAGRAAEAELQTSGGADVDARALQVNDAEVSASGGGSIKIGARESLTGAVSGGGDVCYEGEDTAVDVATSGGGDVGACR